MTDLSFLMQEDDIPKPGYCIFDFSQIALATSQHYFASGEEKVTLDNVRHLILASLKFNVVKARSEGYEKIILALDNAKNGYWRRDAAYYYKLNRAKAREESTFDWEAYFNALHQVISEFKEFMPYQVIDVDKGEADDIIGVLTKYLSLKGHKVRIVSSDGDFPQLQKYPNVTQWSPMQKKFVKPKTGSPELDCMVKIIKGDRKDCVASIKVRSDFYHTIVEGERTPPTRMDFKESMKMALEIFGESKKIDTFTLSLRKSKSVEIIDAELIPEAYRVVKTTETINKIEIKKAIESGLTVSGATIKENNNLQIK